MAKADYLVTPERRNNTTEFQESFRCTVHTYRPISTGQRLLSHLFFCQYTVEYHDNLGYRVYTHTHKLLQDNKNWQTSPSLLQVFLEIIAVQLGPAEDERHVHFVLLQSRYYVLALQDLHSLGVGFWTGETKQATIFNCRVA